MNRKGKITVKKYTCKKTKEEILKIIIDEFEIASADFTLAMNDSADFDNRAEQAGRYIQMTELLKKLEIYKKGE